jgi:hypothetical protein
MSRISLPVGRLILAPQQLVDVAQSTRIDLCQQIGLIATALEGFDNRWTAGEDFLDHVMFMGCSPHIEFEPQGDDLRFCHVRIPDSSASPILSRDPRSPAPRCASCNQGLEDWFAELTDDAACALPTACPHCDSALSIEKIRWRKRSALSLSRIEIWNIFEREAVPSEDLLRRLQEATGVHWDVSYALG